MICFSGAGAHLAPRPADASEAAEAVVTPKTSVINLGMNPKFQKAVNAAKAELQYMKESMDDCYHFDNVYDNAHVLGMSSPFETILRERSTKLQTIIGRSKAHIRRCGTAGKCEQAEMQDTLDSEAELVSSCGLVKKLLTHLLKKDNVGLADAFDECVDVGWNPAYNIVARVWKAEMHDAMVLSQWSALTASLQKHSPRAQAIDEAASRCGVSDAIEECAVYILEDRLGLFSFVMFGFGVKKCLCKQPNFSVLLLLAFHCLVSLTVFET